MITPEEFIDSLTSAEKRQIVKLQFEIIATGKHKDKDFRQRECWIDSVKILAKEKNMELDWTKLRNVNEALADHKKRTKYDCA